MKAHKMQIGADIHVCPCGGIVEADADGEGRLRMWICSECEVSHSVTRDERIAFREGALNHIRKIEERKS